MDREIFEGWLDGVLLAKLDADGHCTELREWWHRQEE
jgi:hypothetical protein